MAMTEAFREYLLEGGSGADVITHIIDKKEAGKWHTTRKP